MHMIHSTGTQSVPGTDCTGPVVSYYVISMKFIQAVYSSTDNNGNTASSISTKDGNFKPICFNLINLYFIYFIVRIFTELFVFSLSLGHVLPFLLSRLFVFFLSLSNTYFLFVVSIHTETQTHIFINISALLWLASRTTEIVIGGRLLRSGYENEWPRLRGSDDLGRYAAPRKVFSTRCDGSGECYFRWNERIAR